MVEKMGEIGKDAAESREEKIKKGIEYFIDWRRFELRVKEIYRRMKEKGEEWISPMAVAKEIMEKELNIEVDQETREIFHKGVDMVIGKHERDLGETRMIEERDIQRYFEMK